MYVGNVDNELTEDEVRNFFSERCGAVKKVHVSGDPTYRFAFVEFQDRHAFNIAMTLNGTLMGVNAIKVGVSKGGQVCAFGGQ